MKTSIRQPRSTISHPMELVSENRESELSLVDDWATFQIIWALVQLRLAVQSIQLQSQQTFIRGANSLNEMADKDKQSGNRKDRSHITPRDQISSSF